MSTVVLTLAASATADAADCHREVPVIPAAQPGAVLCLPTAAWAAAAARGALEPLATFTREVFIAADGADLFDLQRALAERGFDSLVFTGPPEAGARLVDAGFSPVAFVTRGAARHTVVVSGVARAPGARGGCGALATLTVMDPADGQRHTLPVADFAAAQSAEQWLVIFRPAERATLTARGFPLAAAEAVNRRFRAGALLRRALAHGAPHPDALQLLDDAVAADPSWDEPRRQRDAWRAATRPEAPR